MSSLLDMHGRPVSTARFVPSASHDAGAFRDPLAGWRGPQISSRAAAGHERSVMQRRADDLVANDWAAGSALNAVSFNAVGTGLVPRSAIPSELLGIDKDEAARVGREMEWAWSRWLAEADVSGVCHFHDLQLLGLRSMLGQGEMLHLAVMRSEHERRACGSLFSLAVQAVRPQRLQTPADLAVDPFVRDGIRFSPEGRPEAYYVANPKPSALDVFTTTESLTSADFSCIPTRRAHRRLVFHLFRHETEEQIRGISVFASGIALFRNLSDALNYELFAQVMAATFPVFVATESGQLPLNRQDDEEGEPFHELKPGRFYYGNLNQKPYPLESKRPSANFTAFVEIILRAMAASQGIPYESLAKDYSKTNYSSMRAALNEAWKVYGYYRQWFARAYCQPFWEMLVEEAWLRGLVHLPQDGPDFYEARDLWCNASWVGPARGFVDPVKEVQAVIMALENRLMTYSEAWAERGGDFEEGAETMLTEADILQRLDAAGFSQRSPSASVPIQKEAEEEEDENQEEEKQDDDA